MGFDFSALFGNSNNNSSGFGSANWLSDYASIKNGSYRKLMKAYYNESGKDSVKSSSGSKTKKSKNVLDDILAEKHKSQRMVETAESKAYTAVKKATDSLMDAAGKLRKTGDASVFAKKDITTIDEEGLERVEYGYDKKAIFNAVNDYVKSYNSVLQTTGQVSVSAINGRINTIQSETKKNEQALNQIGITIKADGTLSINEDTFMKADMKNAEKVFGNESFYTFGVSESAAMIRNNANYEQLRGNTYTYAGTYDSSLNAGSSYNNTL